MTTDARETAAFVAVDAGRHRHQLTDDDVWQTFGICNLAAALMTDDDSLDLATALSVATVEAERYYATAGALR